MMGRILSLELFVDWLSLYKVLLTQLEQTISIV